MIYPIEKKPVDEFGNNNIWEIEELHHTCLRAVLLRFPEAHPMWHDYLISIVHLRQVDDLPAPALSNELSSHEISCFALNPEFNNQPLVNGFQILVPPNLIFQFEGLTDEQAKEAFRLYLSALSNGRISPDTDYRNAQCEMLRAIQKSVLDGASKEGQINVKQ